MFMFEKPHGMRDTLPGLYETKKRVRSSLTEVMGLWGYEFMETPTLEFYETVGVQSAIWSSSFLSCLIRKERPLC